MKTFLTLVAIVLLCGCAHNQADIWDGELFVSPNGVHTINLDSDEIYEFNFKFGADMKLYNRTQERLFKDLQRRRFNAAKEDKNNDVVNP